MKRWVELAADQVRDAELNSATRLAYNRGPAPGGFEEAFVRAYPRMRGAALAFDRTGVGVFAVSLINQRYLGAMCLASRTGGLAAGVVGRHSQCPLLVDLDTRIALRQLLCIVEPPSVAAEVRGDVRFRLIDLNTSSPVQDEKGRVLESITAEGPILVRAGGVAIFALPTGDPTDWPDDGRDAWACLPERVYLQERLAEGSLVHARRSAWDGRATLVRMHQPVAPLAPALDQEAPVGRLVAAGSGKSKSFGIGREALRRGVLVGCYDRCEAVAALLAGGVSRVHAMLIEIDGTPWLIDTASTAGLWVGDDVRDAVDLSREPEVALIPGTISLTWTPD